MTKVIPNIAVAQRMIVEWIEFVFIVIPPLYRTILHNLFDTVCPFSIFIITK